MGKRKFLKEEQKKFAKLFLSIREKISEKIFIHAFAFDQARWIFFSEKEMDF